MVQVESERKALQARRNRFGAWLWRWRDLNGVSQRALARRTGLSNTTIAQFEQGQCLPCEQTALLVAEATGTDLKEVCDRAGLPPPSRWIGDRLSEANLRQAYVVEGRSIAEIASEIGVSRDRLVSRLRLYGLLSGPPGRRRYAVVDPAPFAGPHRDTHAYWLGFLAADGCVFTANYQHIVRLRLKAADHEHVRRFAALTATGAPVVVRNAAYAEVSHSDAGLVAALAKWGIVPAKTLTLKFPQDLPPQLKPAFVRGYFDGDGSIYWRLRDGAPAATCKFVSGSGLMLIGLERELNEAGIATGKIGAGTGRALVLPVLAARGNLRRFATYLYKDAEVWLPRKRAIFEELGYLT